MNPFKILLIFITIWDVQACITSIPISGAPPPGRYYNSFAYLAKFNSIFVFGGSNSKNYLNDLWVLDLTYYQWTKQYVSSEARPSNI